MQHQIEPTTADDRVAERVRDSRVRGARDPAQEPMAVSDALRKLLWVDDDLKRAERKARYIARSARDREDLRAYDRDGLKSDDIARTVDFVGEVAKAEQERETNLNTRAAAVATVAGLIVTVSTAVAKSVFEITEWTDWTKIAAVALFLAALFAVATARSSQS